MKTKDKPRSKTRKPTKRIAAAAATPATSTTTTIDRPIDDLIQWTPEDVATVIHDRERQPEIERALETGQIADFRKIAEERIRASSRRFLHVTPARLGVFFAVLSRSGNATLAAEVADLSVAHLYRVRDDHPTVATLWRDALAMYRDSLVAEAVRRGRDGYDQDVYGRDGYQGSMRVYDSKLLQIMLQAEDPGRFNPREQGRESGAPGGTVIQYNFILAAPAPAATPPAIAHQPHITDARRADSQVIDVPSTSLSDCRQPSEPADDDADDDQASEPAPRTTRHDDRNARASARGAM